MSTSFPRCFYWPALLLLVAFASFLFGRPREAALSSRSDDSLRVVSTAPSATETLYALGLGESVVAVSDYCKYPDDALAKPKIGSLSDFNLEAIVELAPDFVAILKENDVLKDRLDKLGIETVEVDHSSLSGVLASFETLGARAELKSPGALERGKALRATITEKIDAVRKRVAELPRPRVLISIYRDSASGKIGEIYVAGRNPYFDSILEIVGGLNAVGDALGAVPTLNAEGAIALAPEVIVDLATDGVAHKDALLDAEIAKRRDDWNSLGQSVPAVANGRVYPFLDDYATVPGPRTILFIERLADALHPETNTIK